ncbi:MAG: GGDEF domain-containing protein [Gammaproteobacteria bacterium]|nr:GGDEF domain-containing protein [Gammaproteobacteria bacterium]
MTTNKLSDSPKQILEYYKQAQKFLLEHKIPPTPANYTVAYEYVAARHPDLNQQIDQQIERGGSMDGYFLTALFDRHFQNNDMQKLDTHVTDINQILHQTLQEIGTASDDLASYERRLETQITQLNEKPELSNFRGIAANLLQATQQTQQVSNRLINQLEESNHEITKLQSELEDARREASTDALTGLCNRKALNNKLDQLLDAELDVSTPLSILMLDIDHFKQFNDSYGHLIGDEVIRKVADTLKQLTSEQGIAARYGGEEFIVVMPNTDIEQALSQANAIHQAVAQISLIRRKSQQRLPGITVSVGAACMRQGEAREDLLERADQALYAAKSGGRNRVMGEQQLAC